MRDASCSLVQPRAASCSLGQPRAASGSLVQPRAASGSLGQPRAASGSLGHRALAVGEENKLPTLVGIARRCGGTRASPDMLVQGLALAKRPHIVIATPGRLADHLKSGADVTILRRLRFLVRAPPCSLVRARPRRSLAPHARTATDAATSLPLRARRPCGASQRIRCWTRPTGCWTRPLRRTWKRF